MAGTNNNCGISARHLGHLAAVSHQLGRFSIAYRGRRGTLDLDFQVSYYDSDSLLFVDIPSEAVVAMSRRTRSWLPLALLALLAYASVPAFVGGQFSSTLTICNKNRVPIT